MGDTDDSDVDARSPDDADTSSGSEHLLELLSDLRGRLEMAVPDDQVRRPDATELIRQAQERIATLEQMLSWARAREAELTARVVRGDMRVAHLESAVGELNSIAKRATEAEAGRLRAETRSGELQQQLTTARAELRAKEIEVGGLSARCRDLESDIGTLADELASTMVARTRAERLERERDVALERARAESRVALDERLRAADAERQLDVLRDRLRDLEQRSMATESVTEAWNGVEDGDVAQPAQFSEEPIDDATAEVELGDTVVLVEGGTLEDDEVIELMQEPGMAEDDTVEDDEDVDLTDGLDVAGYETVEDDEDVELMQDPDVVEDDEVVDLTEEPHAEEDDAAAARDEVIVWGEPAKPAGFVGWLRRGFAGDDAPDSDDRD
jgi:hypothetical protein